jgi:hypothetical protein
MIRCYSWTYSDEQHAKEAYGATPDNPYAALPRMIMLTYKSRTASARSPCRASLTNSI